MRSRLSLVLAGLVLAAPVAPAHASQDPVIENPIVIDSFDGTKIVGTLMLPPGASAARPVPVILQTHGWGGTRATTPGTLAGMLLDRGYAMFTWDSRGFGDSGGEANVDSPEFEVKDAQAIMDYLAERPEIKKDGPGDPRLGWIGGSYAGGIQFNTAGIDHRPDALVPEIAWGNLVEDLYPNQVLKRTWDELLYGSGAATGTANGLDSPAGPQTGVYAPEIHEAHTMGAATGTLSDELVKWFYDKSTILRTPKITAPTMIVQGTVDTLFPPEDAFKNYALLVKAGTPVKLLTYCGGHTLALVHASFGPNCPGGTTGYPEGGEGSIYQERVIAWLDRWVKGMDVATGPKIEWQAQDGYYYGGARFPLPGTKYVRGTTVAATLYGPGLSGGDELGSGNPAPAHEMGAFAVREDIVEAAARSAVVGIPRMELTGSVTGAGAVLFFELIDIAPDGTMVTVDDQVMPLRVATGDFETTIDLHGVTWLLEPGHKLQIEITTGSFQYDLHRMGPYQVSFEATPIVPVAPGPKTPVKK